MNNSNASKVKDLLVFREVYLIVPPNVEVKLLFHVFSV